jgi:hypothetical protein
VREAVLRGVRVLVLVDVDEHGTLLHAVQHVGVVREQLDRAPQDVVEVDRVGALQAGLVALVHLDDLLDYEMIVETRRVGNSQMYAINRENPAAEALAQMEWDLLEYVDESG